MANQSTVKVGPVPADRKTAVGKSNPIGSDSGVKTWVVGGKIHGITIKKS
ncbi:hypothetical protein GCM10023350_24980 [Nocardioides endophyticus]|uniref:Uncharacterized protein n=1 Tax=Nocardioides endophyticus TaxID=1353775 RepID=A0ABP8YXK9_9ACTN